MNDEMKIRVARVEDGADIAGIYAPIVKHTFISFEGIPPTAEDMSQRIKATLRTHPWLVVEDEGSVVAYAYATTHRTRAAYKWSCEVSAYVAEGMRRRSLASQLYTQLFATLIRQGFANAFAGIVLPNTASISMHERLGFIPIGVYPNVGFKKGVWRDVGWWRRPLQDLGHDPKPPLFFGHNPECFKESSSV